MSKAPGGKKEIDVYKLNHWRKRKENEEIFNFLFSAWWFLDVKEVFFRPYIVCHWKNESRDLLFLPSRSNLGLVSSRLAGLVWNREIYNLGMVSGPVLLKMKGKKWTFILVGFTKKNRKKNEIVQILVSGALDQTKKIRKTAAEIFAKSGFEKPRKT